MTSPKVYGYLRISTDKQDINNNKAEILLKANSLNLTSNVEWIEETISGTKDWNKRELGKLLNKINKGDIIITSELSRFARTIQQIMEFIGECAKKGVLIYCTKTDFKIDNSVQSQMIIFAYGLSAQIEREMISSRTKSALNTKRNQGVVLGRRKGVSVLDKNPNTKGEIKQLIKDGVKLKKIAEKYNVTYETLHSYIKKHNLKEIPVSQDQN